MRVEPQRAAEGEQAKRLLQVFLRSMVMLDYLMCANAGEAVVLSKRVVNLTCETIIRWMTWVL